MKNFIIVAIVFLCCIPSYGQTTYYVTSSGSNSNPCTSGSPCATAQHVINTYSLGPGDIIDIGAGTWTDGTIIITSADDGDATGYVTIQGVDSASTIFNSSATPTTNRVLISGGNYIKVKNIKFDDASDDMVQISGGSNNIIENCWITNGSDQISIETSGGGCNAANNNIIRKNLLESENYTYVDINGSNACGTVNNDGNIITNNIMKLTASGSASPGIELTYATDTEISNNQMLGSTNGIVITNTGGADDTNLYNNYIVSDDDGFQNRGSTASSSAGNIRHNSFYAGNTAVYFYNISGNNIGNWDIRNNIFYTTNAYSTEYCIRIEGSTNPNYIDYNLYYAPNGARVARRNGTKYTALTGTGSTDWDEVDHSDEAGMLGDENSVSGDPLFDNPSSGNANALDLADASSALNVGTSITGITLDIHGTTRPATPAIGAFDKGDAPLPVELVTQSLQNQEYHTQIDWLIASQDNNDYFLIERSKDGLNFEAVGIIDGHDNSTQTRAYQFNDHSPLWNLSYYRIKQIDNDGTTSVFPLLVSNRKIENEIIPTTWNDTKPNEVIGDFEFIQIYNLSGQLMQQLMLNPEEKIHAINLNPSMNGIYLIRLKTVTEDWKTYKIFVP